MPFFKDCTDSLPSSLSTLLGICSMSIEVEEVFTTKEVIADILKSEGVLLQMATPERVYWKNLYSKFYPETLPKNTTDLQYFLQRVEKFLVDSSIKTQLQLSISVQDAGRFFTPIRAQGKNR